MIDIAAFLCLWIILVKSQSIDWTDQCSICKCNWSSRKKATCTGLNLHSIPQDLSPEIRVIDFSNNPLYELQYKIFLNANLRDIQELFLSNCEIGTIHKAAFLGLRLLKKLDLSHNSIVELDRELFSDNTDLTILDLSYNKIGIIERGLFDDTTRLQEIVLRNNEISTLGDEMFAKLDNLKTLDLSYNKLDTITSDFTSGLEKLHNLYIDGNPWICDCRLNDFKKRIIEKSLLSQSVECADPKILTGKLWTNVEYFACKPQIVTPPKDIQIEANLTDVTLTCAVSGDPAPDVYWYFNEKLIVTDFRHTRKYITRSKLREHIWNNLTIVNVTNRDSGEYKCVAKNIGDSDERRITLLVSHLRKDPISKTHSANIVTLLFIWGCGIVITSLIITMFVCYCFKKRETQEMREYKHIMIQQRMSNFVARQSIANTPNSVGSEFSNFDWNQQDYDSIYVSAEDGGLRSSPRRAFPNKPLETLSTPQSQGSSPRPPLSPVLSNVSTMTDTAPLLAYQAPQSATSKPFHDSISLYQAPSDEPGSKSAKLGYATTPIKFSQNRIHRSSTNMENPPHDKLGSRTSADGTSPMLVNKTAADSVETPVNEVFVFPSSPNLCHLNSEGGNTCS